KYSISIDSVFSSKGDTVTFNYTNLTESCEQFDKYIGGIYQTIKKVSSFDKKKMTYAAEEVPIFHSLNNELLSAFKCFYWQRSVMNVPELQNEKFEVSVISKELIQTGKKIFDIYASIPSLEIWTEDTILTSLKQVEFYWESGAFKQREDAVLCILEIKKMAEWLQKCAERENKDFDGNSPNASFALYNSDLVIGTNCIHINTGDYNFSYISFNSMNSLRTGNQVFCSEIEHWMRNLIKKSTLISGTAEKQRYRFFNSVYKNIDASLDRIKSF
ncbi:MAG: hypothetical protein IAF38_04635, partial [Bacteroidia bacterium]|nr:hypothetical protein [Bacteroidia bacterium]